MIKFVPMNQSDFDHYLSFAIDRYAHEISRNKNLSLKSSLDQSRNQFHEVLSMGLNSPNQFLFTIIIEDTDQKIGMIWYMIKEKNGFKEAFILDFSIDEKYQRQGLGKQTLLLLNEELKGKVDALGLFVFKDNLAAYSLYQKVGFSKVITAEAGYTMRKWFNSSFT